MYICVYYIPIILVYRSFKRYMFSARALFVVSLIILYTPPRTFQLVRLLFPKTFTTYGFLSLLLILYYDHLDGATVILQQWSITSVRKNYIGTIEKNVYLPVTRNIIVVYKYRSERPPFIYLNPGSVNGVGFRTNYLILATVAVGGGYNIIIVTKGLKPNASV